MSLHLFDHDGALRILIAYESGNVALREFVKSDRTASVEGLGWKVLWKVKLHAEASTCAFVFFVDVFNTQQ